MDRDGSKDKKMKYWQHFSLKKIANLNPVINGRLFTNFFALQTNADGSKSFSVSEYFLGNNLYAFLSLLNMLFAKHRTSPALLGPKKNFARLVYKYSTYRFYLASKFITGWTHSCFLGEKHLYLHYLLWKLFVLHGRFVNDNFF